MEKIKNSLKEKVNFLPMSPGVYFWKDAEGETLYIGKAKSLKKRARSYLTNKAELPKINILMSKVVDIDYVETSTEVDALLLEAQLIRKYQPKYNQELKDDKSFPLIKITGDKYPKIHITRNKADKKAFYYGPFTDAKLLREAIALINTLFPIRKCQRLPKTACLYYHIGQCLAPCIKPEVKDEYDEMVGEIRQFLGGGKRSFIEYLTERMAEASNDLRFEDAQYFKEQIEALSKLKKKRFKHSKEESSVTLSSTLKLKHLLKLEKLPEKIVCFDVSNIQGTEAVASKVSFYRELPDKLEYRRYKIKTVKGINDFAMIQEAVRRMLVGLKEGREMFIPDVIMIDGGKGQIHSAAKILKEQGFEATALISIAKKFEIIYHWDWNVGASRGVAQSGRGSASPLPLTKDDPVSYLLQKIRDESHRFAITYHRALKRKGMNRSELDEIPGIGEKRKKILLRQFDSTAELKRAGLEQLSGLPGMNPTVAEKIWQHFHKT